MNLPLYCRRLHPAELIATSRVLLWFGPRTASADLATRLGIALDPQLSAAREYLSTLASKGQAVRGEPNTRDPWPVAMLDFDDTIFVYGCVTQGDNAIVDVSSGEVVTSNDTGVVNLDTAELTRSGRRRSVDASAQHCFVAGDAVAGPQVQSGAHGEIEASDGDLPVLLDVWDARNKIVDHLVTMFLAPLGWAMTSPWLGRDLQLQSAVMFAIGAGGCSAGPT